MARIRATQGQIKEAIHFLDLIPASDIEASVAASGQAAQWLEESEQWDEAIERYRYVLERVPDATMVLRPLARILNRQGRRTEASRLVSKLCQQGDIEEEELRSLLTWSHAFASDDPKDSFAAIGVLGKARALFSLSEYEQVIDLLHPIALEKDAATYSLYGRSLALMQDWGSWQEWCENPVTGCENHADYWYAQGLYALLNDDAEASVVCMSEAIVRDPTDHTAYVRYSESLARVGMHEESRLASRRADILRKTNEISVDFARGHRDTGRFTELAGLLDSLGRPFEAFAWRAVSLAYARKSLDADRLAELETELRLQSKQLKQSGQRLSEQTVLCGVDRDGLSRKFSRVHRPKKISFPPQPVRSQRTLEPLALCNISSEVNLVHDYDNQNATAADVHGILQEMGSGIAVIDFDLDGRADIYLPQAAATPMHQDGTKPNLLFRNLVDRFEDTTESASADDRGFSQGASAGDVNQDGFPDLCVGNVGQNHLLINNGDGTFTSAILSTPETRPLWTSSLAIGDVSGDHLPDVVEVNYIDDPKAFERHASPTKFGHANDRVHFSDGRGWFQTVELGTQPASGLGVVLTDFNGDGRNELFIANDGRPDRLWMQIDQVASGSISSDPLAISAIDSCVAVPESASSNGTANCLCERGLGLGCSVGFQGFAGASMGIAVDDFNVDGRPDLFVTQFYQEPDVFFMQTEHGTFIDRTVQVGTYEPSLNVLGFGTQSIDLDNDSFTEIAVLNGHTAQSSDPDIPFEMLPQIYRRDSVGKYLIDEISDSSNYWHTRALGRGLSTLDWNRDGHVDLVATHLDAPTALLENRTASHGAWLDLRLVGTASERDAIGASVTVRTRDFERCKTVTSGDGYCGKNEAVLHFGLADAETVSVQVQWPSGQSTQVHIAELNQRWLIIEGEQDPHEDRIDGK